MLLLFLLFNLRMCLDAHKYLGYCDRKDLVQVSDHSLEVQTSEAEMVRNLDPVRVITSFHLFHVNSTSGR